MNHKARFLMTRCLMLICVLAVSACAGKPAPEMLTLSDVSLADDAVSLAIAQAVGDEADAGVTQVAAPKVGLLGGLFSPKAPAERTGPDGQDVTVGTVLPYGEIARNCDVKTSNLGAKVDANAGYTLYDSAPETTGLRTHYLTGFDDKCARQFTAATSMMGDIGTHEVVRYLPSNASRAYSATDTAYEAIKASFCRAGHGKPCGAKLDRFAKRTTFLTVYAKFGENPTWSNILLYDGEVAGMGPAVQ